MSNYIEVKSDSRLVKPGDTFVAIPGFTVDGHDFINKAIENGATRIICEHGTYSVDTEIVPSSEKWLNEYLVNTHSASFSNMKFVGITGTNGKTTTAYFVSQMLTELGINNAYIGTIGLYYNSKLIRELPNTTPDILSMYNIFYEVQELGATVVVMEVSSHALYYGRVNGIKLDIGAFTNLTEDHLDFHKTMENYMKSKMLIKDMLKSNGTMVVNMDDAAYSNFVVDNTVLLGIGKGDFNVVDYTFGSMNTDLTLSIRGKSYSVRNNMLSKFNVYNFTMALAIVNTLGQEIDDIINIVSKVYPPKGRNELISVNGGTAIIDYAHTPDAVYQIISAYQEKKQGKIISILGCGGDRDPMKRPIMGDIATKMSDWVIFTNDNPRTEDPEKIMHDIVCDLKCDNYEIILDRASAISKGVSLTKANDVLLILGKGHEEYQIFGHEKKHFSDREEVLKNL